MADHTEIPPEILDLIIHELRNERKALLQCSLVSHDFVLPSRQNLFRTIELQNEHSCHTFKELLQAQPGIGHLVQALIISATPPSNISGLVWFTHAAEDVTYILRCLSVNLHSFHISSNGGLCSFELFPLHLQSALLALLSSPTLVKAEIGTIPRFPISHFATCPQLKDLGIYLRDVDTTISLIAPTPDDARAVGRLNVLQINTSDAAKALVIALTHPYSQLGLSELSKLWVGGGVAAECVWEILNIAQASLKELVWLFLSVHNAPGHIYLGEFASIRSLTFDIVVSNQTYLHSLEWLPESLGTGSAPHTLESLNIHMSGDRDGWEEGPLVNGIFWADLDYTLSRPRYNHLLRVSVRIRLFPPPTDSMSDQLADMVLGDMPLLCAIPGVLQVETVRYALG